MRRIILALMVMMAGLRTARAQYGIGPESLFGQGIKTNLDAPSAQHYLDVPSVGSLNALSNQVYLSILASNLVNNALLLASSNAAAVIALGNLVSATNTLGTNTALLNAANNFHASQSLRAGSVLFSFVPGDFAYNQIYSDGFGNYNFEAIGLSTSSNNIFGAHGINFYTGPGKTNQGGIDQGGQLTANGAGVTNLPMRVQFLLPPTVYAVSGLECNIFKSGAAYSKEASLRQNFLSSSGDPGAAYDDFYRNSNPGTNIWTTNSIQLDASIGDRHTNTSFTLIVAPTNSASGTTRHVLIFGDSTIAGGEIVSDLVTNFLNNAETLSLQGTLGTAPALHDGISGWDYQLFAANGASPFLTNTGALNFTAFVTNNGITLGNNDIVIGHLGINGLITSGTLANTMANILAEWNAASNIFKSVHAYNANIRCYMMTPWAGDASQDAWGKNYGITTWNRDTWLMSRAAWCQYVIANYASIGCAGVIPIGAYVDDFYGFQFDLEPYSKRVPTQVLRFVNGVHPSPIGYQEAADGYYAFLKFAQ